MFLCNKSILATIIPILSSFLFYIIARILNQIILQNLGETDLPPVVNLFLAANALLTSAIPILATSLIFLVTKIMIAYIFEEKVNNSDLWFNVSFSLLPLLVYNIFFVYNLITHKAYISPDNILTYTFSFGLGYTQLHALSILSWGCSFILLVFLLKRKYSWFVSSISGLLPVTSFIIIYQFI